MKRGLSPLRRLLELLRPHGLRLIVAVLTLICGSGLTLLYPQAVKRAVDAGVVGASTEELDRIALFTVAIFVVHAASTWLRCYMTSWLGGITVAGLRKAAFERLLTMPMAWFHEQRSGEIVGRLSSDVEVVEQFIENELEAAFRNALQAAGGIVLLLVQNVKLTLVMLLVVPFLSVSMVVLGRRIRALSFLVQDKLGDANGVAQEAIGAIQTVQAFVREDHEARKYAARADGVFGASLALARGRATFLSIVTFSTCAAVAVIVWTGGRSVISGELSGGDLMAFGIYTLMVAGALARVADLWGSVQRASGATERIYGIIDATPEIRDLEGALPLPPGRGEVRFDGVSFSYPSRPDRKVLDRVSFRIAPGEVVAIVGASGSGKSTLASLMFRFFDVTEGQVLFEGHDVRTLRSSELRRAMAIVSQEPVLFSGTIRENIAYGSPDAALIPGAIEQAAREAHAKTFIDSFPDGFETVVGELGVKLSGGQRQRIAIARALLANPRVLVLDEATSNLDSESEALVQEALARLMKGRTVLVIAHRLSTVRDADRIIVLDQATILETGGHAELMERRGAYRRLVEHQVFAAPAAAT
jgi:ABC transporter fused permease/ATP-binding protein